MQIRVDIQTGDSHDHYIQAALSVVSQLLFMWVSAFLPWGSEDNGFCLPGCLVQSTVLIRTGTKLDLVSLKTRIRLFLLLQTFVHTRHHSYSLFISNPLCTVSQARGLLALTRPPTSRTDSGDWERWSLKSRCWQFFLRSHCRISPWFSLFSWINSLCASDRGRYAGTCWHHPTSPRGGAHVPGRPFPRWCAPTAEAGVCQWSGEEAGTPPRARWLIWRRWPKLCSGDERSTGCTHAVVCFLISFNIWFSALTEDKGRPTDPVGWKTR